MSVESFSRSIETQLNDIMHNRAQIKDAYLKAWLAAAVPDENMNIDWIIKNTKVVERWSEDRLKVTWFLEMKEEPAI